MSYFFVKLHPNRADFPANMTDDGLGRYEILPMASAVARAATST